MREVMILLGAAGVGAAAMYLLDPDRGNRRRALIRDKMVKLNRQTRDTVSGKVRDVTNRAKGMLHEAKSALEPDTEMQQAATATGQEF
jgi:gas vesicle protein